MESFVAFHFKISKTLFTLTTFHFENQKPEDVLRVVGFSFGKVNLKGNKSVQLFLALNCRNELVDSDSSRQTRTVRFERGMGKCLTSYLEMCFLDP